MDTKKCSACGEIKSVEEFHRAGTYYQGKCKPCLSEYGKRRWRGLSEDQRARAVAMVKANKYGFESPEALRAFAIEHGPLCDLCGQPDTTHRKRTWTRDLTMDHNPATGEFRGMLCSMCNLAIGQARDDAALLRKMADYVERFH